MVVVPGVTETIALVPPPAFALQVYEGAPPAVKVLVCPEQIVAGDAAALTVGVGLTVTTKLVVSAHPPLSPISVYVVVVDGLALIELPVPPGDQV